MKIITKKIETTQAESIGRYLNMCIDKSNNLEERKRYFGVKKNPRVGSLEEMLFERKGCLIASVNEIYDWLEKNDPKDSRNKGKWIPSKYDNQKMMWFVSWNDNVKDWQIEAMRSVGARIK